MLEFLRQLAQSFSWFIEVAPWEQAIRVRLGRHVTLLHAGVYFRIPFVDRVFKQSVRRRLMVTRAQTLTSSDGKVVTCTGALGYCIVDLRKLYDTLESAQDTIENETASIVANYVGSRNLSDCTLAGMQEFIKDHLDLTKYGLGSQEFRITSFATAKTYRFITGDLPSWSHDSTLKTVESR